METSEENQSNVDQRESEVETDEENEEINEDQEEFSDGEIEIFPSQQGADKLAFQFYTFTQVRKSANSVYWRCDEYRCKYFLAID